MLELFKALDTLFLVYALNALTNFFLPIKSAYAVVMYVTAHGVTSCQQGGLSHCARLCQTVSDCVTLCQTVSHCVRLCQTVSHCVRLCHTVSDCVTLCQTVSHCARLYHTVSDCGIDLPATVNFSAPRYTLSESADNSSFPFMFRTSNLLLWDTTFLSPANKYPENIGMFVYIEWHNSTVEEKS